MTNTTETVVVVGSFDDIRPLDVRFLQEASCFGALHVFLWDDAFLKLVTKKEPKFVEQERLYYLQAIRYVHKVHLIHNLSDADKLPPVESVRPSMWIIRESEQTPQKLNFCEEQNIVCRAIAQQDLQGFPDSDAYASAVESSRKKVLVTGCFDWFHSGHVRFFEEVSELGDLYVVVGHDENIRALKGEGHPMFNESERRYMVQSVRFVRQALISTGHGWLDAEPEIRLIQPDMYAVNEDGDKPIKQQYCRDHGIEYVVLKRLPKEGLPRRTSTTLRGF